MDEGGYNGKDGSYRQHIVEVGYYVVGVMKDNIQGRVS